MTLTRWLWIAAALSVAAWFLVLSAFERTSHDNRYSGYGIIVVLYALAVPATVIGCAIVATLSERARGTMAAIGFVVTALFAGYSLLVTYSTLAQQAKRRATERQEADRYAALEARIDAMSVDELVRALDDAEFRTSAIMRLTATDEIWTAPCAPNADPAKLDRALTIGKLLSRPGATSRGAILARVRAACPALQQPLLDAVIDGAAQADEEGRTYFVLDLVRADGGGAWLRRAHERIHFTPAEQSAALRNAYGDYSTQWQNALTLLRAGFVDPEWPASAPEELVAKWRAEKPTK